MSEQPSSTEGQQAEVGPPSGGGVDDPFVAPAPYEPDAVTTSPDVMVGAVTQDVAVDAGDVEDDTSLITVTDTQAVATHALRRRWWEWVVARRVPILFALILALAATLRFIGLDWDQHTHLNPDERFLTMVETSLQWPSGLGQYLDEAHSPLNPRNYPGSTFFVYGTLPTTIIRGIAGAINQTGYDQVYLVGRALSALFDIGSIVFLFLLARRLYRDNRVALLASFLLATSVLAIQYAHFMVVDSFTTFFISGALYFLGGVQLYGRRRDYALSGLFFGMALASKVSIYIFALMVALVVVYRLWRLWAADRSFEARWGGVQQAIVRGLLLAFAAFAAFRFGQPDAFRGPGIFDIAISDRWLQNVQLASQQASGNVDFPPNDQWTARLILWFPWSNMVLWGMGLPLGLTAWAGWGVAAWRTVRRREWVHLIPVAWIALVFLQEGTQWVKTMRYFLPIYPSLALMAAWLLVWLWERARARERVAATMPAVDGGAMPSPEAAPSVTPAVARRAASPLAWSTRKALALGAIVTVGTLLWALAFEHIYLVPHSRVQASRWIYAHIPPGKALTAEGWDDALPLPIDGKNPYPAMYRGVTMNWYDEDTPQKYQEALGWLDQADYIIESSNRLYGSIPRLPLRYPMTIRYYKALFDGSLGFKRVAVISSYPQLFGIQIPDQGAEESFTVYDHPLVTIFEKTRAYSRQRAMRILSVNFAAVVHTTPKDVTTIFGTMKSIGAPKSLRLTPAEIKANSAGPAYAQEFPAGSLPMRLPALVWLFWLEVLGLLALPLWMRLLRRLPDRGFLLAKTAGLLLTAYITWLASSLHLLSFNRPLILIAALLVGLASLLWGAPLHQVWDFVVQKRRLLLGIEALFLAGYAADIVVRMIYPDLWHAWDGGEKPMEFSYLNGIVRSQTMPPADPWFSGGYINYYYYGYFLVATMIKLAGIAPDIAYNLAVPTFFSLSLAGAWTAAYALTRRVGLAALAAALTVLAGNLYLAVHLAGTIMSLSPLQISVPVLGGVVELLGGTWQFIFHHEVFPQLMFRSGPPGSPTNWGWDSTRVIGTGNTINEFPFFTFLYADLHAHLMDMPVLLCCAALAVNAALGARPWLAGARREVGRPLLPGAGVATLLVTAIIVGTAGPTNTWDVVTALILITLGLAINALTIRWHLLWAIVSGGVLGILAIGLYYPFYSHLQALYSSIGFTLAHTNLDEFLMVWGLFLFIVASYVAVELRRSAAWSWLRRTARAGEFVLYYWPQRRRVLRLMGAIDAQQRAGGRPPAPWLALISIAAGLVLALAFLILQAPVLALVFLLLGATLAAMVQPSPDSQAALSERARRFTLALALVALGITAACEVAYLADFLAGSSLYRMNTVFKLYEQAWPLFAISSAAALATLLRTPRPARRAPAWSGLRAAPALGIVAAPAPPIPEAEGAPTAESATTTTSNAPRATIIRLRRLWTAALALMLVGVALYPIIETPLRLAERPLSPYWIAAGNPPLGPTLDGTAWVQKAFPAEYQALTWLNTHVKGDPTVLSSDAGTYDNFAFRVPWMTGLPTLVENVGEESQQRYAGQTGPLGVPYPDDVGQHHRDLQTIYSTTDTGVALKLLHQYHVQYIYVGVSERGQSGTVSPSGCVPFGGNATCVGYPPAGLAKFNTMVREHALREVYSRGGVDIYQVIA